MLETSTEFQNQGLQAQGETLDQGYKSCRKQAKRDLKSWDWMISNVAGDNKKGVYALLHQFLQTSDLLDLDTPDGKTLSVAKEFSEDVSNAFAGNFATPELAALVDAYKRYDVDQNLLGKIMEAADGWIANKEFDKFEQLEAFCESFGGSMVTSLAPVIGVVSQNYEPAAVACGKAIMLTQILANCVNDMKHNRNFLAKQDLAECEVDISRLKMRKPTKQFKHLARLYVSRIEPMYKEAGELIAQLDFDGKRSMTSLLAVCWKMLVNMKFDPESILSADGVLSKGDKFSLRSKHVLGMDTKLPFVADAHGHH